MATSFRRNAIAENMLTLPNIRYLTDIYFEPGAVAVLPGVLQKYHITKPLVVTDRELVKLGMLHRLRLSGPVIYDEVETNPSGQMAHAAASLFKQYECDGFIALGGGSPIDLAKCAGIVVNHTLRLEEYAFIHGGSNKIEKIPPVIAIPTTSGSGSEVGRAALLTFSDGRKLAFISDHLLPVSSICDPELTFNMPPLLSAATGMDAISHCVECYCSIRANDVADAIAFDGLKRGIRNIVPAAVNFDRHARSEMMMCSIEGGLSCQKGLGAVHSLSHPLGGIAGKRLHHGTLNAIFLPHVLRFNADYCRNKIEAIANVLGVHDAASVPLTFSQLIKQLGLPTRLRDLDVSRDELLPLASLAMEDHCTSTNPHPMTAEDFAKLYLDAW